MKLNIDSRQQRSLEDHGSCVVALEPRGLEVGWHVNLRHPGREDVEAVVMAKQEDVLGELVLYTLVDVRRVEKEPKSALPATLKEFMEGPLGAWTLARLKAARTYILIAESDAVMSTTASVSLDAEGFKMSVQIVGMAAAYTQEKAEIHLIPLDEVMDEIRNCKEGEETSEASVVEYIYDRAVEIMIPDHANA